MRQLALAGSMFDLRNVVAALRGSGQMERLLSASFSLRAPAYSALAALPGAGFLALPTPARAPGSGARATDPRRRARKPGQAVAAAAAGAQGSPGGGVGGTLQAQVRGNEPEGRVVRHCFLRSCCIVCHGRYRPPGAAWEGWADRERQRPSLPCSTQAQTTICCCATLLPRLPPTGRPWGGLRAMPNHSKTNYNPTLFFLRCHPQGGPGAGTPVEPAAAGEAAPARGPLGKHGRLHDKPFVSDCWHGCLAAAGLVVWLAASAPGGVTAGSECFASIWQLVLHVGRHGRLHIPFLPAAGDVWEDPGSQHNTGMRLPRSLPHAPP